MEILNTPKLEYKASHILVETEQEALEIIDQLNKGDTFEILATDKSKSNKFALNIFFCLYIDVY